MSRKKKILIISHLCFACAYLFWLLIHPYIKEIVAQKTALSLYEMVIEREVFFKSLSQEDQTMILNGYEGVHQKNVSLLRELGTLFFIKTPPFALAWLFFSLIICLLLLFRIDGAGAAAWLLPCIVLGYIYFLKPPQPQYDSLFPSEAYVLNKYVDQCEIESKGKRECLLLGWHRYLVTEWAHETPNREEKSFNMQLEKALFAFNVARLKLIIEGKEDEVVLAGFTAPPSLLRLASYFIWNVFFAWYIHSTSRIGYGRARKLTRFNDHK